MEVICFGYEEAMVSDFFSILQHAHLSVEHDRWDWRHIKEGTFLVASAYNLRLHLVSL